MYSVNRVLDLEALLFLLAEKMLKCIKCELIKQC